jgi:cell division transport system ATP-binding protein
MDDEALIQYKNEEIHQQELCVLSDVNLELHKGEFVYLNGKVGSEKRVCSRLCMANWT